MIRRAISFGVLKIALLIVGAVFCGVVARAWADPVGPTDTDRLITQAVVILLDRDHLLQRPVDDEVSKRWLKTFLEALDPQKIYFYQSDIDEFEQAADRLDDMARVYDIGFAYRVYARLLQRVDESAKLIERALATPPDFTADEQIVVDRDQERYPRTPEEAWDRWRKRIKYDLLVVKADDKLEGKEAIEKLRRRYHYLANWKHKTDSADLREMFLSSMTGAMDPHTSYMSPASSEDFMIAMRLEFEGIGATLKADDGVVVIEELVPGGAADKDGRLKKGDKIVGVGQGADGEMVDVVEMPLTEVVKLIRGKRGTVVRLQIDPIDNGPRKIVDITRAKIELKNHQAHGKVFEAGRKANGTPYKVGVINLPSFYSDMEADRLGLTNGVSATRDVRAILDDFTKQGVDAAVLDLRYNGGGSLKEAIDMTGLFIPEGPIVQVKGQGGRVRPRYDRDSGVAWRGPLVVLINKFSASASEILAGAIQDYRRGLVVGDHATHGKGTVQSKMEITEQLMPFRAPDAPDLGSMKITIEQYYRPAGDSTQIRGVLSDIELPSLTSKLEVGEADLDYPIAFDKVDSAYFSSSDAVNPSVVERLRALSAERCAASKDFQRVERNIKRYEERKNRKYETLNEKKFMAEWDELKSDRKEEEDIGEKLQPGGKGEIDRNYYLDEVLAITLDYMQQMKDVARAR